MATDLLREPTRMAQRVQDRDLAQRIMNPNVGLRIALNGLFDKVGGKVNGTIDPDSHFFHGESLFNLCRRHNYRVIQGQFNIYFPIARPDKFRDRSLEFDGLIGYVQLDSRILIPRLVADEAGYDYETFVPKQGFAIVRNYVP